MLLSVPWRPVSPLRERGGRGDRGGGSSVSPALPLAFQQGSLGFLEWSSQSWEEVSFAKSAQSWGKWRNPEVCGLGV